MQNYSETLCWLALPECVCVFAEHTFCFCFLYLICLGNGMQQVTIIMIAVDIAIAKSRAQLSFVTSHPPRRRPDKCHFVSLPLCQAISSLLISPSSSAALYSDVFECEAAAVFHFIATNPTSDNHPLNCCSWELFTRLHIKLAIICLWNTCIRKI